MPTAESAVRSPSSSAGAPQPGAGVRWPGEEPYYVPAGQEVEIFARCHARGLPVMLKGPTGCGKTRFVEHVAWRLQRPLVTIACHDDLSSSDLTGRYLIRGGETVWMDGPLAVAARLGAICYLDEVVEARQDTVVVIHPLTDDRRLLPVEKTGELIEAAPGFQLVVSYNPGYQHALKDLKPSTRQRFVALEFDFPPEEREAEIVAHEGGVAPGDAKRLVRLATRVRRLRDQGLAESPSTRLLVSAARLMAGGIPAAEACRVAVVNPLTDDPDLLAAIGDLIAATL
jgi:nitric oxide reductase NorQ protein